MLDITYVEFINLVVIHFLSHDPPTLTQFQKTEPSASSKQNRGLQMEPQHVML